MANAASQANPPAPQTRPLQSFQRDQTLVKVGRRSIVGSNNPTAPVIEASYPQCIGALNAGLAHPRLPCKQFHGSDYGTQLIALSDLGREALGEALGEAFGEAFSEAFGNL
ncbi:MAG: hypothetical protein KC524_08645 [Gammaproteobacteria bacterium]|nr:hypothetical protein [Gammaproteobacteria bacterium]